MFEKQPNREKPKPTTITQRKIKEKKTFISCSLGVCFLFRTNKTNTLASDKLNCYWAAYSSYYNVATESRKHFSKSNTYPKFWFGATGILFFPVNNKSQRGK